MGTHNLHVYRDITYNPYVEGPKTFSFYGFWGPKEVCILQNTPVEMFILSNTQLTLLTVSPWKLWIWTVDINMSHTKRWGWDHERLHGTTSLGCYLQNNVTISCVTTIPLGSQLYLLLSKNKHPILVQILNLPRAQKTLSIPNIHFKHKHIEFNN